MTLQLKTAYLTTAVGVFLGTSVSSHASQPGVRASQPSEDCRLDCEIAYENAVGNNIEIYEAGVYYCNHVYTGPIQNCLNVVDANFTANQAYAFHKEQTCYAACGE